MVRRPIHRLYNNNAVVEYDELAEENIISIFNNDDLIVRLLATPQDLEDLAIGHIALKDAVR